MLSKAHKYLSRALNKLCKIYNVTLIEELVDGSKRYDFYIPTKVPVVIECDGTQHNNTKADKFFFKNIDQLEKYKKNDYERKKSAKQGNIILFNYTTDDFPSIEELEREIGPYLLEGDNDRDANLIKRRNTESEKLRKREFNRECREKAKKKYSNGN